MADTHGADIGDPLTNDVVPDAIIKYPVVDAGDDHLFDPATADRDGPRIASRRYAQLRREER